MKFTAQEEYGLRCILGIARDPGGALTIPEISEREGLSPAYVAKLMRVLRRAGVVTSVRGQKGGYRLAESPEAISLGRVLGALGGRLYPKGFCSRYKGTEQVCVHHLDCSIRTLWIALDAEVERALSQIMLKDLICSEREMKSRVSPRLGEQLGSVALALSL